MRFVLFLLLLPFGVAALALMGFLAQALFAGLIALILALTSVPNPSEAADRIALFPFHREENETPSKLTRMDYAKRIAWYAGVGIVAGAVTSGSWVLDWDWLWSG